MEAHALVAATTVTPYDQEDEEDEEVIQTLGPAAAAATALVYLHDGADGAHGCTPKQRLPALLEKLIVRGLQWGFSQSEAAKRMKRGEWVDAALTPLLDLATAETAGAISDALSGLRQSHQAPPECEAAAWP